MVDKKTLIFVLISLIVHLILYFGSSFLSINQVVKKKDEISFLTKDFHLYYSHSKTEKISNTKEKLQKTNKFSQGKKNVLACKKMDGGIGINYKDKIYKVSDVIEGYPAYEAGIKVDDFLDNVSELIGPVGTPVMVNITRGKEKLNFLIIRKAICLD